MDLNGQFLGGCFAVCCEVSFMIAIKGEQCGLLDILTI